MSKRKYPYQSGDYIVLGPETFSDAGKTVISHKGENYYARRDEPLAEWEKAALEIDPAAVKVGDVVEVEADDGSWLVRGEVKATDGHPHFRLLFGAPHSISNGLWPNLIDATVRLVRRAAPDPDPEQVKALWNLGHQLGTSRGEPLLSHDEAAELIRRGVTVRKDT